MNLTRLLVITVAAMIALPANAADPIRPVGENQSAKTPSISNLRLKVGESFLEVRSRLVSFGWKPVRMHSNDAYEYDGAEKRLAERGFLEVDSCSFDAGANCILYYRKAAKCLRLDTVGEQVSFMKVTRWTGECPSDAK